VKENEEYNIGLDIGTASVGWCVTDLNNNVLKIKGKNMWGSRIFEEAQTAAERRNFRSARRRLTRRKERINILQDLMREDIEKEYSNFLPRLKETSLKYEDKIFSNSKYNLFSDNNRHEISYYEEFPTIYHLRNKLIKEENKVDIRLVYLAIHHIIKYRGNFLYDGDFSNDTSKVDDNLEIILEFLNQNYQIELKSKDDLKNILLSKNLSKAQKKDELMACFNFVSSDKTIITNIINAILGYSFEINKIFDCDLEKSKIKFSNEIDNEEEIENSLESNIDIYYALKDLYSWYILQDIMSNCNYISESFMKRYEKFKEDLKLLKKIYKEYFPNQYDEMFKVKGKNNFVNYIGKNKGEKFGKCDPEDFFKMLKSKIKELPDTCTYKEQIELDLQNDDFLRKLNIIDNGAIPYQLHKNELSIIIKNQSKYYNTLKENGEKIISLLEFRIPYYVGPLANDKFNKWNWVVRNNENEKIRPWNFSEIINEEETAEKFINRMTNKCTYLLNEKVMPKESLLYSKFCVLNELNNIRINEKHIPRDLKKKIVDKLFKQNKKVTIDMFKELCKIEGLPECDIIGIQDGKNFMSNMSSYMDMSKIFGKVDENNYDMCETLIYWITIFEDKKILKKKIKATYSTITEEQLNKLLKLKYSGWSRLSKKLLVGLKSNDYETIMDKLEKTSMNFMQIINNKNFGFDKKINDLAPVIDKNITYKDVSEIPTSPANKRGIWQAICVVKEITKVMNAEPKNIFIEFARSEEFNKNMSQKRAKKLLKIYDNIQDELATLKEYDSNVYEKLKENKSNKDFSERMQLYFMQLGKCLYSGEPLNIEDLNLYEVDHILPQAYIKDDSIDNKALVKRIENQTKKDNLLLSDKIINNMSGYWKKLLDLGLITKEKYLRLTKRKIFENDYEQENFVKRQLVETRQITKYVTNLLKNSYTNTDIFTIRAELTHAFREEFGIYKNRNVNNYHHAHDAYIISIIGNVMNTYIRNNEEFKYGDFVKKYLKENKNKAEKNGMIIGSIKKNIDIGNIKKVFYYKDCFISRMLIEGTGAFYDQTLYSPKINKNKLISLKDDKDSTKYGGYSGEKKAYFSILEYINENGLKEYKLLGIPIKVAYDIKAKKYSEEEYIKKVFFKNNDITELKVIKKKVLKNQQYLDENKEVMRFCSDSEIRVDKELVLNYKMNELIYLMNMKENQLKDNEKDLLNNNFEYMFDYLLEKIKTEYKVFSSIYKKLLDKKEQYMLLENEDKKCVINGLVDLMKNGQGNLKKVGLTEREGRKSKQNFDTKRLTNMIFIDKSVTGIYERRINIYGMENSSSK
jgi:CRISPR-associated endonuclease Csn1